MEKKSEIIAELIMLAVMAGYAFVYSYEASGMALIEQKLFIMVVTGILFLFMVYRSLELAVFYRRASDQWSLAWSGLKSKRLIYFLTLVLYFIVIPVFGFFIATYLFLILFVTLFGSANRWTLLAFPAIFTATLYVIFKVLLSVRLPQGMLFP